MKGGVRWVLAVALLLVAVLYTSHAFMPTATNWDAESQSHQTITERAVLAVVERLLSRSAAARRYLPEKSAILSSASFQEVLGKLTDAAGWPDFDHTAAQDPGIHFNDEQIVDAAERLRRLRLDAIREIKSDNMVTGRWLAGRALHSVQDFYSHTNWMEMNNRLPNSDVGVRPIPAQQVAAPDLATCVECVSTGSGLNCRNNIIEDVNRNGILTSGYADLLAPKPRGKCSHGGVIHWNDTKVGGINKDSVKPDVSPHHYLHDSASSTAVQASIDFLESIRLAVVKVAGSYRLFADEDFAEFLGISTRGGGGGGGGGPGGDGGATTLCFIVDTTGSMSDEIAAVRQETIRLTREVRDVGDYVLSPFNDPGYGPVFKTTSAEEMIAALGALRAKGGGDGPELAFHGIRDALTNVRVGSTCFLFTDAPAKDRHLYPTVLSLAVEKKVRIYSILTNVLRRRRSAGRQKRATYSYFDTLSRLSGGLVLYVRKSDISDITRIIEFTNAPNQVTVFYASSRREHFTFHVDATMSNVIVQVADAHNSLLSVTVTEPDGSEVLNHTRSLTLSSLHVYNVSSLQPGVWNVSVVNSRSRDFSAVVAASTPVSFTYRLAVLRRGPHGGYAPISGNPIAGETYYLLVTVYGARDLVTGLSTGLVRNVTHILIVSLSGDVLMRLPAFALQHLRQYAAPTVLPDTDFVVGWEGEDAGGNTMRRVDEKVMSAVTVKLDITVHGNGSFTALPGSTVAVAVNVSNVGDATSWYIRVSDTSDFYTGNPTIVVNSLGRDEWRLLQLNFVVPDTSNATTSAVTITAGTSSVTNVENFQLFHIVVKPQASDEVAPVCTVGRVIGQCKDPALMTSDRCADTTWSVEFDVIDAVSGLISVSSEPGEDVTSSSLEVSSFNASTTSSVSGRYEATCCHSNVTINAVDAVGNIGQCFVDVGPLPPTSPPPTVESTTSGAMIRLPSTVVIFSLIFIIWTTISSSSSNSELC